MKTDGRERSTNVEVRTGGRGGGGGFGGGGGGGPRLPLGRGGLPIGVIILLGLIALFVPQCRGPIIALITGGASMPGISAGGPAAPGPEAAQGGCDVYQSDPSRFQSCDYLSVVLKGTETVWTKHFQDGTLPVYTRSGVPRDYPEPTLVIFENAVQTACGNATAAIGPFYCPGDDRLYIDLAFNRTLAERLNSPGDFAQAYVVGHEVGHHVQKLIGATALVEQARGTNRQNEMSVRLELQADCLAGVWAHDENRGGQLNPGDIDEALAAAHNIGDDTLQRQGQGYINPDSFTHGTSEQRMRWFRRGFDGGDPRACETFQPAYGQL